jgi:hypothetical protein
MKTIGSHPGAILFRMSIMVILIAIMIMVFFFHVGDTEKQIERASVLQTKRIIDSALAVVFSTHAVRRQLDQLNDFDGGNPFVFLEQYSMLPAAYVGEIGHDAVRDLEPGWYYLSHRRIVLHKSFFDDSDTYFRIKLSYQDNNRSGSFEAAADKFNSLQFVKITEVRKHAL